MKKLSQLIKNRKISIPRDCAVTQVTNDSREVISGSLFFALRGSRADGSTFIKQALEKGATAVFSETDIPDDIISTYSGKAVLMQVQDIYRVLSSVSAEFYDNPSRRLRVFGITGTKGKTTSACILEKILEEAGEHPGLAGTLAYRADGKTIGKAINTTPFAHTLHSLFSEMLKAGCHSAVMEVSSHALALNRVEDVCFDSAVFTNLQSDHMDFHKDRKNYFAAKAHLFELLAANSSRTGAAVINADDGTAPELVKIIRSLGMTPVTYGIYNEADFRADEIRLEEKFSSFILHARGMSRPLRISLPGMYNIHNALAAVSAAVSGGIDMETAVKGAEKLVSVPGRLQRIEKGQNFNIFVDYAHTADSLLNVLQNLRRIPHRKIITVFGCGGDRDRTKRGPMGRAACENSDIVFVTDDNPRYENREQIFTDIENGIKGIFNNYEIIPGRETAIRKAVLSAGPGDIVLIAGKGHENYQLVQGKTLHFSDTEEAEKSLAERGWK